MVPFMSAGYLLDAGTPRQRPICGAKYRQLQLHHADGLATLRATAKKCHICKGRFTKSNPPALEHIIPLSRGGPNHPSNIAFAHEVCNKRKARMLFNPMTGQGWLL
jgi:5-methylcytosine-specific restriction endonuclease McrA